MKISEIINRLDKSKNNSTSVDQEELMGALYIESFCNWFSELDKKIKGYYIKKSYCTDTYVGLIAWFFDDDFFAISSQEYRKSHTYFYFKNEEYTEFLRDYILSLFESEVRNYELIDMNEDFPEFYQVQYTSQLLSEIGYVDGRKCKVIKKDRDRCDRIVKTITVKFEDDNSELEIPIDKFDIKIGIV